MDTRRYFAVSSLVFGLASSFHLARLLFGWPVRVGRHDLPRASSLTGFLGAAGLAAWGALLALRDDAVPPED